MDDLAIKQNGTTITIGSESNFWRYSKLNGFDLTRQGEECVSSAIHLETTKIPITIDPSRSALVIIDMQNLFLHPCMRSHETGLLAMNQLINYVIPTARKASIQIIWLNWGLTEEDINQIPPGLKRIFGFDTTDELGNVVLAPKKILKGLGADIDPIKLPNGESIDPGRLLMRNTWNAQLYDPLLKIYENSQSTTKPDRLFHKNRTSGLWEHQSPLLSFLEENNLCTLFFAGVNTDQCVYGTLQDAFNKGFDCILVRDGCGTSSPSFARECIEYNCAKLNGFIVHAETFAKNVESQKIKLVN